MEKKGWAFVGQPMGRPLMRDLTREEQMMSSLLLEGLQLENLLMKTQPSMNQHRSNHSQRLARPVAVGLGSELVASLLAAIGEVEVTHLRVPSAASPLPPPRGKYGSSRRGLKKRVSETQQSSSVAPDPAVPAMVTGVEAAVQAAPAPEPVTGAEADVSPSGCSPQSGRNVYLFRSVERAPAGQRYSQK
ncbi:hypothetical protein FJT64_013259 [Amphibalanus amphitrite]|uniref:Uncharacterized protein n=1 Tax=Amphibalanus amphitrite TaxID=1232801 RepID=A0A6A4V405_AMPAM|nr:hypothetical protein FJT64_013259 [Amphibalanus amphitrite]